MKLKRKILDWTTCIAFWIALSAVVFQFSVAGSSPACAGSQSIVKRIAEKLWPTQ